MIIPPSSSGATSNLSLVEPQWGDGANNFYGKPIPISMGLRLIVGVPLWASDVRQTGTGDAATRFVDFAIGFGRSGVPSDELITTTIQRLWVNDTLVIDRESIEGIAVDPDVQMTLYPGSEAQLPDPTVQAALGADTTPAFRGMVYAVFRNFPLHKFGLQVIPFVRAVLADMTHDISYVQEFDRLSYWQDDVAMLPGVGTGAVRWCCPDWPNGRMITFSIHTDDLCYIQVYDILQNKQIASNQLRRITGEPVTVTQFQNFGDAAVRPDTGEVLLSINQDSGTFWMTADPLTGLITGRVVGSSPTLCCNIGTRATWNLMSEVSTDFASFAVGDLFTTVRVLRIVGTDLPVLSGEQVEVSLTGGSSKTRVNNLQNYGALNTFDTDHNLVDLQAGELFNLSAGPDATGDMGGCFYVADTQSVYRVHVPVKGYTVSGNKIAVDRNGNFIFASSPCLTVSKFWTVPAGNLLDYMFVDTASGEVVVLYSNHASYVGQKLARVYHPMRFRGYTYVRSTITRADVTGVELYSEVVVPDLQGDARPGWNRSDISAGTLAWITPATPAKIALVQLGTGTYFEFNGVSWRFLTDIADEGGELFLNRFGSWNSAGQFMVAPSVDSDQFKWSRVYVGRAPGEALALSDILRWQVLLAGVASGDLSVTGIDDFVYGSILTQRVQLSDLLNNEAGVFAFDWFESEGKVKLVKRARGDDLVIDLDLDSTKLAWVDGDESDEGRKLLVTQQNQDSPPPTVVEVKYLNKDANFSVDLARATRTLFPVNTAGDGSTQTYEAPVVMTSAQAGSYAIKALYGIWTAQVTQEFRVSAAYLATEPSDIVRLTRGAFTFVIKITQAVINGDWSVSLGGNNFAIDDAVTIATDTPASLPQGIIPPANSDGWWLDTPRLDYSDNTLSDDLATYTEVTSRGQAGWTGGALWMASDGANFSEAYHAAANTPLAGIVLGTIPTPGGGNVLDVVNHLSLSIRVGSLDNFTDATDDDLDDDLNFAFWGSPGRWEVVQIGTMVDNGDGTADVSRIVRGRRGTEWAMRLHAAGDKLIMFSPQVRAVSTPLATLGQVIPIRAVGDRISFDTVPSQRPTVSGNSKRCFAPIELAAAVDGSDLDLSWTRRSRLLCTELIDGDDDAPLDETEELYDIELLGTEAGELGEGNHDTWANFGGNRVMVRKITTGDDPFFIEKVKFAWEDISANSGVAKFRGCVYSDDGTGNPGTLLGQSGEYTPGSLSSGNHELTLDTPVEVAAGQTFFVGVVEKGITGDFDVWTDDSGGLTYYVATAGTDTVPPSTFGAPTTSANAAMMWAVGSLEIITRTISDNPGPAYKYLAADITTDLGGLPDSLRFRVYQIGGIIGRGFVADARVDVT